MKLLLVIPVMVTNLREMKYPVIRLTGRHHPQIGIVYVRVMERTVEHWELVFNPSLGNNESMRQEVAAPV
jgi:hypothetical protein